MENPVMSSVNIYLLVLFSESSSRQSHHKRYLKDQLVTYKGDLMDATGGDNCAQIINPEGSTEMDPVHGVHEWTDLSLVHAFYFVKYWVHQESKIKLDFEQANLTIERIQNELKYLNEQLQEKKEERVSAESRIYSVNGYVSYYQHKIDMKTDQLVRFQNYLNKDKTKKATRVGPPHKVLDLCEQINGLNHRVRCERLTSREEKKLINQMKELQVEIEKVETEEEASLEYMKQEAAEEAMKREIHLIIRNQPINKWISHTQDYIDLMKSRQLMTMKKIKQLSKGLKKFDWKERSVEQKIKIAESQKEEAYRVLRKSEKLHDRVNSCYYQNLAVLKDIKDLVEIKDIAALKELSENKLEKYFTQWKQSKDFKDRNRVILPVHRRPHCKIGWVLRT
ncbi:hypothetical protein LUZ60_012428 [Juncus effusus]|nr:hypothetical protein LUZ60_012428 [Juncus effusus]